MGAGGVCWQREPASLFQVLLKLTLTYGKGGPGDFHPTINEWGEAGEGTTWLI
jgi:hypothetical protein